MNDIDINVKMRLIGYYMSDDQFMRTEVVFPEKAEKLAELLQITFDTILENRYVDDDMRAVFKGNTVFILKGENGKLYGYYPKYNIARLTNVHYVKPDVTLCQIIISVGFILDNDFIYINQRSYHQIKSN